MLDSETPGHWARDRWTIVDDLQTLVDRANTVIVTMSETTPETALVLRGQLDELLQEFGRAAEDAGLLLLHDSPQLPVQPTHFEQARELLQTAPPKSAATCFSNDWTLPEGT